ncbi:MAG: MATE family efflux transporter [Lachnospiraceae bacterium]|nr:MATE family efflux transporter [Lachnospiraceae bacterium]
MAKFDYRDNKILKNIIGSVGFRIVGMFLSMLVASMSFKCLGDTKYGIFASTLSITSWIYYFDLGIGNGMRNQVGTCIATGDFNAANKNINISFILNSGISVIIFLLFYVGIQLFDVQEVLNVKMEDENLNGILLIATGIACLNFVFALVNNILYATQNAAVVSFFSIVGQALYVIGLYVLIKFGIDLILYVAVIEGIGQLLKNIIATFYTYSRYRELKFSFKMLDFSHAKVILTLGLQIFALQMASLILNSTDNIIILRYFGGDSVTPYSFCYKYFSIINMFMTVIMTPLWSAYTAAYTKKDISWINRTIKKSLQLYIIVFIGTWAAVFLCKPVIKIWLGKELAFSKGLIILTAVYFLILMFSHIFSTFVNGIGKVKEATIVVAIEAIINIPLSILFSIKCGMGVNGVILGSIICVILSIIVYPYVTLRELKILKEV